MSLHLMIAILLLTHLCLGSHFRGGIVTWTPTGQDLQIEVSYRVSWRRSAGHVCDYSTISSGLLNSGEGTLECTGGCTNTSVRMDYYCTDFSTTEDWTTGTRTLIYNLTASSTEIFFTFTSCCWIDLATGGGNWAIKAKANASKRTDTGRINSSPTTSVSPVVRVPYGCNTTINILVADKDGDKVRCRWSNSSDECGDICISLPGAVLNKETCTISYHANGSVGYYGVAVQVEDFASTGVTVPYSSVPVQFLVYVYSTTLGCYSLPEFIAPTKEDQEVVYITFNTTYVDKIIAISKVPNTSIAEIVTVSPSGFIKSALAEYTNVTGSWYVNITWTPTASDVDKLHILCFTATDKAGLTSKQRCINLIVLRDVTVNATNICVNSCSGKSDGNYQHCSDCQKYVACSNGYKFNMPCPANLVWDDRTKQCDYKSSTCSSSTSANTKSSLRTTPIVQTPTVCVNSCRGISDGDYQNCQDCRSYVSCSNGATYTMPCSSNLVWDDRKKRCEWVSSTCP